MKSFSRLLADPAPCEYLEHKTWQLEYEEFEELSQAEFHSRLLEGWRRFGHTLFRPQCPSCRACQSIRVLASYFKANDSQKRVQKANLPLVRVEEHSPSLSREKLELSSKFHLFQEERKQWSKHERGDPMQYFVNFVHNPFPTEEWNYFIDEQLVGIGYVDVLPDGLSAIYFYYDPAFRKHSLGTWNVLALIENAKRRRLPYVYLGYYVAGSRSMEYKARFKPFEILGSNGKWNTAQF